MGQNNTKAKMIITINRILAATIKMPMMSITGENQDCARQPVYRRHNVPWCTFPCFSGCFPIEFDRCIKVTSDHHVPQFVGEYRSNFCLSMNYVFLCRRRLGKETRYLYSPIASAMISCRSVRTGCIAYTLRWIDLAPLTRNNSPSLSSSVISRLAR